MTDRIMKTFCVLIGIMLFTTNGFGMGHPHNLFAARQRVLARLQAIRQLPPGALLARPALTKSNNAPATCQLPAVVNPARVMGRFLGRN